MLQNSLTRAIALLMLLFAFQSAYSQDVSSTDSILKDAPLVFVDCQFCDLDYIRQQIPYVNYVRDRKASDVHILVTQQATGSGGEQYTLAFYGQGRFAGMTDTLSCSVDANATDDEKRVVGNKVIKMGLMRYIAKTPIADQMTIDYAEKIEPTAVEDKWKNWVFSANANAWFNGESLYKNLNSWSNISAVKITPDLKIEVGANMNYGESSYDLNDSVSIVSVSRSHNGFGRMVFSMGNHFSWGATAFASTSLFSNQRFSTSFYPGIEYNLYPYSESTRRQLRILLSAGPQYKRYHEVTIYEKAEEFLWGSELNIAYAVQEKWGSVSAALNGSMFLTDLSKHRLTFNTNLNLRLFKGLSLRLSGRFALIRDQINLPLAGATAEDVLLQQRQLATDYSYWGSAGLTYTFGSIYNSVVNPRFGMF